MGDEQDWEDLLSQEINDITNLITSAYQAAENEILLPFAFESSFTSADLSAYPLAQKKFNQVITLLTNFAVSSITSSVKKSWDISNRKNNKLVNEYFKGWTGADVEQLKERYFNENLAVRKAFLERKTNGLNLSERVWNYNEGYKKEIEDALQIGISNGVSAKKMAKLLKDYLRNPSATIMEVDQAGVATQLIGKDKTGAGVYRDPMKNALRLARTETNIAYRTADCTRYAQLDFIVGYEVHLSKNHTSGHGKHIVDLHDICDELQGKYPKDFKFSGWHPHCRCYMTTILKSEKEMKRDEELIRQGKQPSSDSKNSVPEGKPPLQLRKWINANTQRLENSTSLPYFVRDNVSFFGKVNFNDAVKAQFQESAAMKKASILERAKIRHNSRTPEQIQDIKARWAEHEKNIRRKTILKKAEERHAARTKAQIEDIKTRWEERKQKKAVIKGGEKYYNVASGFKFEDKMLKALKTAIGKKDVKKIEKAVADLKAAKNSVKKMEYVNLSDFRKFSADELQSAVTGVKSKLQQWSSLSLENQKAKLEFEIQWVQKSKKYPTWEIAERAYKAELAEVEYKIRVEEYKANLADFKAYKTKSKAYNDAVKDADKLLSGARLSATQEADIKALFKSAEGDFLKSHKHITTADFGKFTLKELESADDAVSTMLSKLATQPLSKQQAEYSKQIADLLKYKKYKTWSIAERAYKAELAKVEYQIRVNDYTDRLAALKKFKTTDKTFAGNLKKAEKLLTQTELSAVDETTMQKLLSDMEAIKNTASMNILSDAEIQALEDKYMQMIKAAKGKYSVTVGSNSWKPADKKLADLGHEYQKAVEEKGYVGYKTAPKTPSIDKVTQAQIDAAKKQWLTAKPQYLSYVQDPVGGVFKGDANYITKSGNWDAWSLCQKFAKKMQGFGVDVTPEELSIIARYTYKSGFINKYLLGLEHPTPAQATLLDAYKIAFNSVLTKLPKYQGVTFRGACLDKSKMAKGTDGFWNSIMQAWNKGGVWDSKAPMSTTANVDTPAFFGTGVTSGINPPSNRQRILFVVKGKTGVSVSDIAIDKKQDEVLFRAGSKFKITKKPYQITKANMKNAPYGDVGDYLVELEEI